MKKVPDGVKALPEYNFLRSDNSCVAHFLCRNVYKKKKKKRSPCDFISGDNNIDKEIVSPM